MTDATNKPLAETGEPVAWARRWYIDGEVPVKERKPNGRLVWQRKFTFHEVTKSKIFPDDAPLYTHPQPSLSVGLDRDAVATIRAALNSKAGTVDLRDFTAELTAILALAAPADGWQPIETAPKDGTWIIGATPHGVTPLRWGVSWDDQHWANGCVVYQPTHWMPLPAAPTGETGA